MYNISAFTHVGTISESNQDGILVNGTQLNDGEIHLINQNICNCFVADGVGGNKSGDFASFFVLEKLMAISDFSFPNIEFSANQINEQLISISEKNYKIKGAATTLTGLIANDVLFQIIHAGDSQIWLLRNDMIFKITTDHILDETQSNSPVTSYFGGFANNLKLDKNISIHEGFTDDIFIICSDGLLKSLNIKVVKTILKEDSTIELKAKKLLKTCLETGAEDNISLILIHQIN
jgi:PPM family protein phosphatase